MAEYDYTYYADRRDANTIAKFVAKMMAWNEKYALYKNGSGGFPRPIGKNAKWPAYEAASRLERSLGLDTHASSVPELAALVGVALATFNKG